MKNEKLKNLELQHAVLLKMFGVVYEEDSFEDILSIQRTKRQNMYCLFERLDMSYLKDLEEYDDSTPTMLTEDSWFEKKCHLELLCEFRNKFLRENYSNEEILQCYEETVPWMYEVIFRKTNELPLNFEGTERQLAKIVIKKTKPIFEDKLNALKEQIECIKEERCA